MTGSWYVVNSHPRAEFAAAEQAERAGFDVYVPRCMIERRHARRRETVPVAFFPRYFFAGAEPGRSARVLKSIRGVTDVVTFGGMPALLDDLVVRDLRAREDDRGYLPTPPPPSLRPGTCVRVTEGPLKGVVGVLAVARGEDRVALLLSLLGRPVRTCLPAAAVTACS